MRITPALAVLGAAALFTLAGCGDDDGGGGEYADALAESIRAEEDNPFEDDTVDCIAGNIVEAVGEEDLEAIGTPEEVAALDGPEELGLDEDQAVEVGQGIVDCGIGFADLIGASGDQVDPEVVDCLDENVDEGELAEILGLAFVGGEDLEQSEEFISVIGGLLEACPGLEGAEG